MPQEYQPAPDVEDVARRLVNDYHSHLSSVRIDYVFTTEQLKEKGKVVWGRAKKVTGLNAWLASEDRGSDAESPEEFFVVEIHLGTWLMIDEKSRRALVDHELHHLDVDIDTSKLPRQHFCDAELGRNKAVTLAGRYSAAWGVEIAAVPKRFRSADAETRHNSLNIFVGCVDNAAARGEIAKVLSARTDSEPAIAIDALLKTPDLWHLLPRNEGQTVSAHVERMENWKELAIGALIAQAVASVWFYLRSIGNKVSKEDHEKAMTAMSADHDKAITALKTEIDKTNAELKNFARQGTLDEVKGDFRRLETKIDAKLDTIQQQLLTLLARDHK